MVRSGWRDGDAVGFPISWTVRAALWRVVVSVLAPVVWLGLTLLFFGFWATGLTLTQDVVVGIVSILALLGALTVLWLSFGIQLYRRWVGS
jgi:hypothetical protein